MVKISQLPGIVASNLSLTDIMAVVDAENTVTDKATLQQLITFFFNNVPAGTIPGSVFAYVISGGVWSGDSYASNRNASMTAISVYLNTRTIAIGAVTARTFTASKDTYIDILDNQDGTGTLVYTEVANNAASPALASNSIRIAIIVTGATTIASVGSVNQGEQDKILPIASSVAYAVTDSLGNLICPRDPNRNILGHRQVISNQTGITTVVDVTGLSVIVTVPTGRKIMISCSIGILTDTDNTANLITINEGATVLKNIRVPKITTGADFSACGFVVLTPSAGVHTYKIQATSGGGNMTVAAASTTPAEVLVELH
jgi:hypothetical protein